MAAAKAARRNTYLRDFRVPNDPFQDINIGRRTGIELNIKARKFSDGFENIDDYFPDSDAEEDNRASQVTVKHVENLQVGRRTGVPLNINARINSGGFENVDDYFPDSVVESVPGSDGSVKEHASSAGNKDSVIYKDDSAKEEDMVAKEAEPTEGQGLLGMHEDSPNNTGTAIKCAASREPTPQLRGTKKRLSFAAGIATVEPAQDEPVQPKKPQVEEGSKAIEDNSSDVEVDVENLDESTHLDFVAESIESTRGTKVQGKPATKPQKKLGKQESHKVNYEDDISEVVDIEEQDTFLTIGNALHHTKGIRKSPLSGKSESFVMSDSFVLEGTKHKTMSPEFAFGCHNDDFHASSPEEIVSSRIRRQKHVAITRQLQQKSTRGGREKDGQQGSDPLQDADDKRGKHEEKKSQNTNNQQKKAGRGRKQKDGGQRDVPSETLQGADQGSSDGSEEKKAKQQRKGSRRGQKQKVGESTHEEPRVDNDRDGNNVDEEIHDERQRKTAATQRQNAEEVTHFESAEIIDDDDNDDDDDDDDDDGGDCDDGGGCAAAVQLESKVLMDEERDVDDNEVDSLLQRTGKPSPKNRQMQKKSTRGRREKFKGTKVAALELEEDVEEMKGEKGRREKSVKKRVGNKQSAMQNYNGVHEISLDTNRGGSKNKVTSSRMTRAKRSRQEEVDKNNKDQRRGVADKERAPKADITNLEVQTQGDVTDPAETRHGGDAHKESMGGRNVRAQKPNPAIPRGRRAGKGKGIADRRKSALQDSRQNHEKEKGAESKVTGRSQSLGIATAKGRNTRTENCRDDKEEHKDGGPGIENDSVVNGIDFQNSVVSPSSDGDQSRTGVFQHKDNAKKRDTKSGKTTRKSDTRVKRGKVQHTQEKDEDGSGVVTKAMKQKDNLSVKYDDPIEIMNVSEGGKSNVSESASSVETSKGANQGARKSRKKRSRLLPPCMYLKSNREKAKLKTLNGSPTEDSQESELSADSKRPRLQGKEGEEKSNSGGKSPTTQEGPVSLQNGNKEMDEAKETGRKAGRNNRASKQSVTKRNSKEGIHKNDQREESNDDYEEQESLRVPFSSDSRNASGLKSILKSGGSVGRRPTVSRKRRTSSGKSQSGGSDADDESGLPAKKPNRRRLSTVSFASTPFVCASDKDVAQSTASRHSPVDLSLVSKGSSLLSTDKTFTPGSGPSIRSSVGFACNSSELDSSLELSDEVTLAGYSEQHAGDSGSEQTTRRSKRTIVPPLQYWKNERLDYERRKSGGWCIKGIIRNPTPTPRYRKKSKKSKPKRPTIKRETEGNSADSTEEDITHEQLSGFEAVVNPVAIAINPENNEEVNMDLFHTAEMLNFTSPSGAPAKDDDPLLVHKFISQPLFGGGQVILRPGTEKGKQYVRNDTMVFYVIKGRVLVTVHASSAVLNTGSTFFVPQGNSYNIKNLRKTDAKLMFVQLKG